MARFARGWPKDRSHEWEGSLVKKVGTRGLLGSLSQPGDSASSLGLPAGWRRCPSFHEEQRPPSPLIFLHLLWSGK